jgi:hypothetical protein
MQLVARAKAHQLVGVALVRRTVKQSSEKEPAASRWNSVGLTVHNIRSVDHTVKHIRNLIKTTAPPTPRLCWSATPTIADRSPDCCQSRSRHRGSRSRNRNQGLHRQPCPHATGGPFALPYTHDVTHPAHAQTRGKLLEASVSSRELAHSFRTSHIFIHSIRTQ